VGANPREARVTELHEALSLWVQARLAFGVVVQPLLLDPSCEPFPPGA